MKLLSNRILCQPSETLVSIEKERESKPLLSDHNSVGMKRNYSIRIPYYFCSKNLLQNIFSAFTSIARHFIKHFNPILAILVLNALIIRLVSFLQSTGNVTLTVVKVTLPVVNLTLTVVCVTLTVVCVTLTRVCVGLTKVSLSLTAVYTTLTKVYHSLTKVCFTLTTVCHGLTTVCLTLTRDCLALTKGLLTLTKNYLVLTKGNVRLPKQFSIDFVGVFRESSLRSGEFPLHHKTLNTLLLTSKKRYYDFS